MIPKIIHYCWFGNSELPDEAKKCIESWKKHCPDYEIKRWDESNYDVKKNQYMKEAYENKKWGFVPDFARLDIIYNYGGIYLDTDVEIIKPLDNFLVNKGYMGFEDDFNVNPGIGFAAEKGLPIIKKMMDTVYQNRSFKKEDGTLDLTASPVLISDFLSACGMKRENSEQMIEGLHVYPKSFFCPIDYETGVYMPSKNTHTIHHFMASWVENEMKMASKNTRRLVKIFGVELGKKLANYINMPLRLKLRIRQNGIKNTLKHFYQKWKNLI